MNVAASIAATGLPIRTYSIAAPTLFFDHTPAWVYYLAALTKLGGDTLTLARLTALAAGAGTVALVYLIAWHVRGPIAGLVGASILAVNPFFAELAWFARMEVPLAFCVTLAVLAIVQWERGATRWIWGASAAIAVAVMLKEIALAFWFIAVVYVALRGDRRAALIIALPSLLVFAGWLGYAQALDGAQLGRTITRWSDPAAWDPTDPRGHIALGDWLLTIAGRIIGWVTLALLALAIALISHTPRIALLPSSYAGVAVLASLVISIKEPRFLVAVAPMLAVSIGLIADWDARVRHLARLPRRTATSS
jgi:4-amino-4-deoxy-L-arabinose transferase-like glycosyltransferase